MKHTVIILTLLVSMMASAQLPLLLDHGRAELIGVPPNPTLVQYLNDVTYFYGDSITAGYDPHYPSGPALTNRFSTLLCQQYSMIESNLGVGGSQIADWGESDTITSNNVIFGTNVSVWFAGYNDMRFFGTNAAALTDNATALECLAAWLALPTAQRVPWNSPNIYYNPGGWVFDPVTFGGMAHTTATGGGSASFYFMGSTLLIGTARGGGCGNALVVVGDVVGNNFIPTLTNTYSCLRTSTGTGAGRSYSPGLILFTNLSETTNHGAIIYAQSTASIFFSWYAAYSTNQLPKVVLAGTLKMPEFEYGQLSPYNNGSDLAADQYSEMISNVAVALSGAKLNVKYVPAPLLDTNTDFEFDWLHPNPSGHLKIKNALQSAF